MSWGPKLEELVSKRSHSPVLSGFVVLSYDMLLLGALEHTVTADAFFCGGGATWGVHRSVRGRGERGIRDRKEKLKTRGAALEALVGDPKRISQVAADLVKHFEKRVEAMDGKAMIVCMSRRICVDLYDALIELRPEWEAETLKVVMTGSAEDGPEWQKHIGNKKQRRDLANEFKDPKNPFRIVIVRDMWLTGFDAPCLHTMYADKPMQGHGLMQAIARVNRVFRDKPGGLVVDYLGLADQLKQALVTYTESGGQGDPTFDTAQAIAVMLEKHGIACDMMHGFDWAKWTSGPPTERLKLITSRPGQHP